MTTTYTGMAVPNIAPAGYTGALQFVWIGDSLISGYGSTGDRNSVSHMYATKRWHTEFFRTHGIVAYNCLNKGIGGQNITQIEARYAADVVANDPDYAVNEGGINDVIGGTAEATFLAKRTAMTAAAAAAGIIPVEVLLGPWTNATTAQAEKRDLWNADLISALAAYPSAIIVDLSEALGKNRPGGPSGNLWDIKTEYSFDGLHLNNAGYTAMAQAVYEELN